MMRKLTIGQQEFIAEKKEQQLSGDEVVKLRLQLKTERLRSDLYKKIKSLPSNNLILLLKKVQYQCIY